MVIQEGETIIIAILQGELRYREARHWKNWGLESGLLWFDTCRIFVFSLLFSTQSFPSSCYKCVFLPLIFSSLMFSLVHLVNFPTYFSTHFLPDCCLSCFLSSHADSTSQTCSPRIAALWLFSGYAVCYDNVSFFFLKFIAAGQTGEKCPVEQRDRRREEEREAWLRNSPRNST